MNQPGPIEDNNPGVPAHATRHHIRFVEQVGDGQAVFMAFVDPIPARAVRVLLEPGPDSRTALPSRPDGSGEPSYRPDNPSVDAIEILTVPGPPNDPPNTADDIMKWVMARQLPGTAPPLTILLHGTQVIWHPDRAAILAAPERMDSLLLALVEFSFYEKELGKLESAVAESWPLLEVDATLAFEVTARDLERLEDIARQAKRLVSMRMRQARLAPRLKRPGAHLSSLANQLGERLREKSRVEDRLETLAGQLEVFERVYELTSQRLSEFRTSRKEQTLEWLIILLLAAETLLLLIEVLHNLER